MARKADVSDFRVSVEGIGSFVFARRKMSDEIAIQVEYARIIDGVQPTEWLSLVAGWLSALKVLTVKAPEGWDIDEMDPLDEATYANLGQVYTALTDQERSFRTGAKANSQGNREESGADR